MNWLGNNCFDCIKLAVSLWAFGTDKQTIKANLLFEDMTQIYQLPINVDSLDRTVL